jgi:hypothetical protein
MGQITIRTRRTKPIITPRSRNGSKNYALRRRVQRTTPATALG